MARNTYNIDEVLESPFNFKHIKRSLHYVSAQKSSLLKSLGLNILIILLGLLQPIYSKIVIDEYIPNKNIQGVVFILVVFVVSILISSILSYIQSTITARAGQEIVNNIRTDLYSHIQKLPFSYFDNRPHGKILVRVVNYVNNVANFLSGGLVNIVIQLLSLVFIAVFMLSLNVKLSLIIISGVPFLFLFIFFTKKKRGMAMRVFNNKCSNLNAFINESLNCMRVTQSFAREEYNNNIFKSLIENHKVSWLKVIRIVFKITYVAENLSTLILISVFVIGSLVFQDISFGTIIAMSIYASRFWGPILSLGNIYNELFNTSSYLERIFETLDEPIDICDHKDAYDIDEVKGEIEFKNVTFSYIENINIIEKLSFSIKPGESIALVGPTGAGKTTIVNLLCRFYDINEGEILLDKHPIQKLKISALRKNMGVMLQDTFIFNGTILDNIRYGRLDATDEEIYETSKKVCADDFIKKLPNGYHTIVNERGSTLSNGQRQLISFARTLLANPKILILDEATSSIDIETEVYLQEGIKSLLKGRTSFIIAHRLSTIKNCDRIFYVNNKGIEESGSHTELMNKKGRYYELYKAQQSDILW